MSKAFEMLLHKLNLPQKSHLGSRITKKMLLEQSSLVMHDKRLIKENLKSAYWEYTLKPSTCTLLPYHDHEREYLEIAILKVEMTTTKKQKKIAEILHRVIPYPLMIIFIYDSLISLSLAPKRLSRAEKGAYVIERVYTTDWLSVDDKIEFERDFINSLDFVQQAQTNYLTLYNSWLDRFVAYNCAKLTKKYVVRNAEERRENLARCHELELKISELRSEMKNSAFNKQVELNVMIKKCENELSQLTQRL